MKITAAVETWPYKTPFRISRGVQESLDVIVVSIEDSDGRVGRGEAAGVDYEGETLPRMLDQIAAAAGDIECGAARSDLAQLLPPGGARNALDCALWDLEAKQTSQSVARLAGLAAFAPVLSAWTIGIGSEAEVRAGARALESWPLIKIKTNAEQGLAPVRIIRDLCPKARFIVDPNQSWSCAQLNELAPELAALGVALVEQPIAVGEEASLADYSRLVPVAADESCRHRGDLGAIAPFFDVVNIKLDKTGGLTEALALKREIEARGLGVMVGCMAGTSLAMAPAMLVAQGAAFADLDGPLLHKSDRPLGIVYENGWMQPPSQELWG
jgi:L-Ala-D/L-Glu epimerase